MKQGFFTVTENRPLTAPTAGGQILSMTLRGDTSAITVPGQFVNLQIDGLYLRRPISVCDLAGDKLVLVYRVVGKGTERMAAAVPGDRFDVLTGLGNGYDTEKSGRHPLLIGGGVGVPPLYLLAKRLLAEGKQVTAILGFRTASESFLVDAFCELGVEVTVATEDGSEGVCGFVTDAMAAMAPDYTYFYTCGPEPMLRAVDRVARTSGQFSFEERMGCGFGACMGCSCETKYGSKRICRDGPVLEREEIIW